MRELRAELADLRGRAGNRERDLDLLVFEIGEIEALEPDEARSGRSWSRSATACATSRGCARPQAGGAEAIAPDSAAAARRSSWRRPSGSPPAWPGWMRSWTSSRGG